MKFCELGVAEVFYRFDETGVGGSVLDIGAGAGDIVRALRDADIQAVGQFGFTTDQKRMYK